MQTCLEEQCSVSAWGIRTFCTFAFDRYALFSCSICFQYCTLQSWISEYFKEQMDWFLELVAQIVFLLWLFVGFLLYGLVDVLRVLREAFRKHSKDVSAKKQKWVSQNKSCADQSLIQPIGMRRQPWHLAGLLLEIWI